VFRTQLPGFWNGFVAGGAVVIVVMAVIAASTWLLGARSEPEGGGFTTADPSGTSRPVEAQEDTSGSTQDSYLDDLVVAEQERDGSYDRALFGQTWADVDRNGCDTRNDILGRDLDDVEFKQGTRDCKVLAGTLQDPYSGTTVSFTSGKDTSVLVQIDHIVPLAWAWYHGARDWTDLQREGFANDPRNLLAVNGDDNQGKSDSGPALWMPPAEDYSCEYIERFVAVLVAYDLTIGSDDAQQVAAVERDCA
jgi:hypothetical protein